MPQTPSKSPIAPRTLVIGGVLLLAVGLVVLNALARQPASGTGRRISGADVADAALVAQGKLVYAAHCASCHGPNLEGQPDWQRPLASGAMPAPPHDATGHTWHHNDQSLFATVRRGGQATAPPGYQSAMPAFPQLSDEQIWAVLAFIKSSWPPDIQRIQQQQAHQ